MILLVIFLMMSDFQDSVNIKEYIEQEFTIFILDDETLTGCSTTSSADGKLDFRFQAVDWLEEDDLNRNIVSEPSPVLIPMNNINTSQPSITVSANPRPVPEPTTFALTPEPPAAILTVTGLTLLYLIFGRKNTMM
ncbi:MAG: hypothetical protein ACRC2T_14875 [Thermoguttaceae bacterium]